MNAAQIAPCPICNARGRRPAFSRKGFTYYRCARCGTLALWPLPSAEFLEHFYNTAYRVDPAAALEGAESKGHAALSVIAPYARPPGRLLEIGSSWGGFLHAAQRMGWQACGVEPSAEAAAYTRHQWGVEAFAGTLADAPYADQQFDLVTFWHTIEHDRDPRAFLAAATSYLRPGGVVAFTTPNAASAIARLAGPGWEWSTPPAHLALLTPRAIDALLRASGLQPLTIITRRGDARPFAADLAIGLIKRAGLGRIGRATLAMPSFESQDHARRSPQHNPRVRFALLLIRAVDRLSAPTRPLGAFVNRALGWGPEILAVARKPV